PTPLIPTQRAFWVPRKLRSTKTGALQPLKEMCPISPWRLSAALWPRAAHMSWKNAGLICLIRCQPLLHLIIWLDAGFSKLDQNGDAHTSGNAVDRSQVGAIARIARCE